MRRILLVFVALGLAFSCAGERKLYLVATGDVHGAWLSESYIEGGAARNSLMSVKYFVDSLRDAVGKKNVLLLDAGDCLQGDNAAYYYNYVDTAGEHLFTRIVKYMGYDAITVGNHDIETGHKVYDKVAKELEHNGIVFLAGNAVRTDNGKSYFPMYKKFRKAGMNVLVFGFTNAAIKTWLSEELWEGMDFKSLTCEYVQSQIDEVLAKEKADVVIISIHSGTGNGDGGILESQALDLLQGLKGVDVILCGHDHRKTIIENNGSYLVNASNKAKTIVFTEIQKGSSGSKLISAKTIDLDKYKIDTAMKEYFESDYQKVKAFTNQTIGDLAIELRSRDAFAGMSPYINLVHTVMLGAAEVQVSIAAPLSSNGIVKAGEVIFNDLFTIYPFENQMFVLNMSGREIKDYLEYSYNLWIDNKPGHLLKIQKNGSRWNFIEQSYNFDSAGGLVYTVDVTKPYGKRVGIKSLADGTKFSENEHYKVAMTSYRANGGGSHIIEGAGIAKEDIDSRVIARYPEIRDMVREFITSNKIINEELISDQTIIGNWHFIPEKESEEKIAKDLKLLFK